MTTQTILNTFIAFGGLRVLEEGLKYVLKSARRKIGAERYDKALKIATAGDLFRSISLQPEIADELIFAMQKTLYNNYGICQLYL